MKPLIAAAASIVIVFGSVFAQETKKDLTEKAALFYRQGNFEKAVETAEKVVKLEKSGQSKDTIFYANALLNLARIRQGQIVYLQNKADGKNVSEKIELARKTSEIAAETETLLRQILTLNEDGNRGQTVQTADVKSELASLVQSYNPAAPSIANSRARIDDAEKLMTESLAIYDKINGKDDQRMMAVVLQNGDFYYKYVNFEKALPFYERYRQAIEKKNVKDYPETADALRRYAAIMLTTFQDSAAADAFQKIEEINGQKEAGKPINLSLNLRSKDAVAYGARIMQSSRGNAGASGSINIPVSVVVDENGRVIEAAAESDDKKLRARAEREVLKWTVRPFVYQGVARRMRGRLTYFEKK